MNAPQILIAGIGNIFLGDDAFGVEIVRRMMHHPMPGSVRLIDFGIRGMDLAYALLEDYDGVVLIDAMSRGGEPGTLYVVEPDLENLEGAGPGTPTMEAHRMDPVNVLRLAQALGGHLPVLRIVGCEPATFAPAETGQPVLSAAVEAATGQAITLIEALVHEWLSQEIASCTNLPSSWKSSTS